MSDLETIDAQLAAWEEHLRRVDENLLTLEADATYQLLAGSGRASLEGVTASRIAPALEAMERLFDQRERLRGILDRAKELRAAIGTFTLFKDDKVAEIDALLHGPSIAIAGVEKPIEERSLLDAATREVAVVPEEMLRAMVASYEIARDAVTTAKKAWAKLEPAIEEIEAAFARAKKRLASTAMRRDLDALEATITSLRKRVASDPLSVDHAAIEEARRGIAALEAKADVELGAIERFAKARAEARALRGAIEEAIAESAEARAACARGFVDGAAPADVDRAALGALDEWLAKIEETAAEGNARRAEIGLARWFDEARGHLGAARAPIERRVKLEGEKTELLGRLSARKAQLEALKARRAVVDEGVLASIAFAEATLRETPCAIAKARAAIEGVDRAVAKIKR